MRIFRTSWNDKNGEKREVKKWWIELRDHKSTLRRFPGFTDRKASEDLGRQIERLVSSKAAGEQPGPALSRWLESIPDSLTRQLTRIGLLDSQRAAGGKPLSEHLEDFQKALIAKGGTLKNARLVTTRVKRVFNESNFAYWNDIQASHILYVISILRKSVKTKDGPKDLGDISAQTYNFYIKSVKQFCKWMVLDNRATKSPVDHLETKNVKVDRRHDRRALEPDEIRHLLEVTRREPKRLGMTGPERALLYQLAAESGLRSNEIRSLTVSSFDFEQCTVTVKAGYSKRKREDVLPLKPDTMSEIRNHLENKLRTAQAFTLPSESNVAKMLKKDLAAAGIEYVDAAGKFCDFHSLRHTTGSMLAAAGVNPKVAQALMRHSTIELTLGRYSHIYKGQETDAIASLPDLAAPSQQAQEARATGTDGKDPDPGQAIAREPGQTEKPGEDPEKNLACFLAKTGGKQQISIDGGGQKGSKKTGEKNIHNPLSNNGKSLSLGSIETTAPGGTRTCDLRFRKPLVKNHISLKNQSVTKSKKIDLAHFLAEILAENPDLIPVIEKWPAVSLELRRAIGKMLE